ncbi:MAG: hypothetical protein AAFV07_11950 [Bacteroidota bacterium]
MQKIWDTQTQSPLYTLREADLFTLVERKIASTDRAVRFFEQGLILINLLSSAFLGYQLLDAHDFQIVILVSMIAVLLAITAYVWWGRSARMKRQAERARRSDYSVLQSLEAAIEDRAYLIRKTQTFIMWYLLPLGATLVLAMWYKFEPEDAWKWGMIGLGMLVSSYLPGWEARAIHKPKKKALENLRDLLMEEVPQSEVKK